MILKNRVAIVTGAGSGIGRASAILFATEGAKVVVADVDRDSGGDTVETIRNKGGEAIFVKTDVSNAVDVNNLTQTTIDRFKRLDILFNNAGISPSGTVLSTTEDTWERIMNVNLKGPFLGCKYAIPHMIKQGGGSIVNTASTAGIVANRNDAPYCASKGGVVQLTKATALDFGPLKIRVNCICPGTTNTPMIRTIAQESGNLKKALKEFSKHNAAILRMIEPEEVANLALFLASDAASAITGGVFVVDGGFTAI